MKILLTAIVLCTAGPAWAGVNFVTGMPVTGLQAFDSAMIDFMNGRGIQGGVLAVSRNGCVVYQRGFGVDVNPTRRMPENTPMRLASVEKPITAAVIWDMINDGLISANDFVFDMGQVGTRLLPSTLFYPYDGEWGDDRIAQITVMHLLQHQGGWDIAQLDEQNDISDDGDTFDPQFECVRIAEKMGVASPPGRLNTVRYMLAQPLQFTPGMACGGTGVNCDGTNNYSNFGYTVLGLIVERYTGFRIEDNVRSRLLTPQIWVPSTEIFRGRTFRADQDPREPWYLNSGTDTNVFDPDGADVAKAYGGWDQYAFQGHGNLVASAAPVLKFLDRYSVWYNMGGTTIGQPYATSNGGATHTGGMPGTSTAANQDGSGINIVVLFPDRAIDAAGDAAGVIRNIINTQPLTWPNYCVDGVWVDFDSRVSGHGGFNDPFVTMGGLLSNTTDGTRVHLMPGGTGWTGTISGRYLFDAPYQPVEIGR